MILFFRIRIMVTGGCILVVIIITLALLDTGQSVFLITYKTMQITYNGVVTPNLRLIVLVPQWAMDIGPNKMQLPFETSDTSTPVAQAMELIHGLLASVLMYPIRNAMMSVIF
jgi:hypothetical protein